MRDSVKKLTEIVKELGKLSDQLIKLLWKVATIISLILFILHEISH